MSVGLGVNGVKGKKEWSRVLSGCGWFCSGGMEVVVKEAWGRRGFVVEGKSVGGEMNAREIVRESREIFKILKNA